MVNVPCCFSIFWLKYLYATTITWLKGYYLRKNDDNRTCVWARGNIKCDLRVSGTLNNSKAFVVVKLLCVDFTR